MFLGISRMRRRSSSHLRVWMLNIMVRLALVWSVTWTLPLVSFQISQVSMVPKSRSPFLALSRAPGTLSSSHLILEPEK